MQWERVKGVLGKLDSLSPLSILRRGYSITRKIPTLELLIDAGQLERGDPVEVRLHRGFLVCEVRETTLSEPSSAGKADNAG